MLTPSALDYVDNSFPMAAWGGVWVQPFALCETDQFAPRAWPARAGSTLLLLHISQKYFAGADGCEICFPPHEALAEEVAYNGEILSKLQADIAEGSMPTR